MEVTESWRVQVDDRVYEADLNELIEWIKEGAVSSDDLVQKGSLRWLSAGRVPELAVHYFKPTNVVVEDPLAGLERNGQLANEPELIFDPVDSTDARVTDSAAMQNCITHPAKPTALVCNICRKPFCAECPNRFGSVKLCPFCGGICANYEDVLSGATAQGALNKPYARKAIETANETDLSNTKLGIRDVLQAIKYSFSNPVELAIASAFISLCVMGSALFLTGGILTTLAALVCGFMMVVFGFEILSLTYSNVSEGKGRFQFFRRGFGATSGGSGIRRAGRATAAFARSFGLFIMLVVLAGAVAWNRQAGNVALSESAVLDSRINVQQGLRNSYANADAEKIALILNDSRRTLTPSALQHTYLTNDIPLERVVMSFMRLSVYFLVPIFILLIIGIIHYPAACSTALVTRSVRQTLNPLRALRHIRLMGFDHVLLLFILLTFISLFAAVGWAAYTLSSAFLSPLLTVGLSVTVMGTCAAICLGIFSYLLAITIRRKVETHSILG
jgi:hypothetical protein